MSTTYNAPIEISQMYRRMHIPLELLPKAAISGLHYAKDGMSHLPCGLNDLDSKPAFQCHQRPLQTIQAGESTL